MIYEELEKYVSNPRLQRYLLAGGNSKVKAQKIYRANIRVCQAYYPILNLFETILRNCVNDLLSTQFADPDWIRNQARSGGFMSHNSLRRGRFFLQNQVQGATRRISRSGTRVTSSKIIAEQSFGFWVALFQSHHYALIGGSLIHIAPNKPAHVNRLILSGYLDDIRDFRNRVYHNEPICFNAAAINFNDAEDVLVKIHSILDWIDPSLSSYVKQYDNIDSKITIATSI
jgi:hypothetical protein